MMRSSHAYKSSKSNIYACTSTKNLPSLPKTKGSNSKVDLPHILVAQSEGVMRQAGEAG